MKNKRGQTDGGIFQSLKVIILIVLMMITMGVMNYGYDLLSNEMEGVGMLGVVNGTEASQDTFGAVNNSLTSGLKLISASIIFGLILFTFLSSYFIEKGHPAFIFVHIVVNALAVVVSIYLSNFYETLLTGQPFSSFLMAFRIGTSVILNLPLWTTIIGLFSTLFLLMKSGKGESPL